MCGTAAHQVWSHGGIQHVQAQLVDEAELLIERVFELLRLRLRAMPHRHSRAALSRHGSTHGSSSLDLSILLIAEAHCEERTKPLKETLAGTCVSSPREKSKTSSLSSFRMIMLFSHSVWLVLDAPTSSGMNVCHLCGQSCFSTCRRPRARQPPCP